MKEKLREKERLSANGKKNWPALVDIKINTNCGQWA
jgi:hypothetical protein